MTDGRSSLLWLSVGTAWRDGAGTERGDHEGVPLWFQSGPYNDGSVGQRNRCPASLARHQL